MTALNIKAEIVKAMVNLEVTEEDIMRVTGWSRKVFKARWADFSTVRLNELQAITGYLNMELGVN